MRISSLQKNLKQGLSVVSHIAGKNSSLPILNNILIEAKDGNIKLITTNLEIGIVYSVRGKVEEEGMFTVDSKVVSDYVSLLPNKRVDIKKDEKSLIIETENYKTKILGQEAEDFPLIPSIEKDCFYKVNASELKKALSQVIFAVSNSETRMELSGVLFDFNDGKLVVVSTDSYRLAEKEVKIETNVKNGENKKIIIPAKTIQELIKILSGVRDDDAIEGDMKDVEFYVSENQVMFSFGPVELISRLIEGQYPDYRQIIPGASKTKVVIVKDELVRAVKMASLFSKTGINDVNLDFPKGKNTALISSISGQAGENMTELSAEVVGEDNGVVINHRYFLDGLNNFDSENILIEVIDNNTPCILRPEKGDGYLYLIMPIKQ